jgi:integrase
MPRPRKPQARKRTSIAAPYQLPSGLWRYRVRDTRARAYITATFTAMKGPGEPDEHRRTPGCSEGDTWAAETRAKLALRLTSAGKALTADVLTDYVQELNRNRRNATHVREVERVLGDLAKVAPDMKASGFYSQVMRWRDGLKAKKNNDPKPGEQEGKVRRVEVFDLAPVTINRYTLHVRSLVRYAMDRQELHHNPLASLKDLDEADPIKATFTIPELRSLIGLRDYDNDVWTWAAVMAFTGMRAAEALHLRWQDVNLEDKLATVKLQPGVYDLKRAKERTVPIVAGLHVVLTDHPHKRDIGFIVNDKDVRDGWNTVRCRELGRLCKRAGFDLGDRTPHSFRHTYAAIMVAAREDVFSICRALGHADLKMTEHYSREAAAFRPLITREGWKPGELRLLPADAPATTAATTPA